jgi:hypothetical protein
VKGNRDVLPFFVARQCRTDEQQQSRQESIQRTVHEVMLECFSDHGKAKIAESV